MLERVIYNLPCAQAIKEEADKRNAERVFLLTIPELSQYTPEIEKIRKALGTKYAGLYDTIPPHAPMDHVLEAAAKARQTAADMIVSIGGSSVTDACKVLSICLKHGLTSVEQLEPYHYSVDERGRFFAPQFEGPDIPIVAVPTTLSGAEFTDIAGAKNHVKQIKEGFKHAQLVPRTVILDPTITVHTPDWLWFSTGVRALDHTIETLGSLLSNDFCDGLAESALKLLFQGLRNVKKNPTDLDARLKCQFGVWQSMMPGAAGVPMGVSHAIGHVLGGYLNIPHGYTSCVIAPYAMSYNETHNRNRQNRIAQALGHPDRNPSELIKAFIIELEMPYNLQSVGIINSEKFQTIAEKCMLEPWIWTNPRPITKPEDVIEILKMAQS